MNDLLFYIFCFWFIWVFFGGLPSMGIYFRFTEKHNIQELSIPKIVFLIIVFGPLFLFYVYFLKRKFKNKYVALC